MVNLLKRTIFFLLIFSIPIQTGKHFWLNESLVLGRRVDYYSPTLYVTDILLLLWAGILLLKAHKKEKISKAKFALVGLALISLISLSVSPAKILTLYFVVRLWELALFYYLVLIEKPKIWQVLWPLGLGALTVVFIGLIQFFDQSSIQGWAYFLGERKFNLGTPQLAHLILNGQIFLRPYSIFSHPNVFGGYLITLLPLFVFVSDRQTSAIKYIFKQAVIFLSVVGILLTFSRTVWLAALIILGIKLFFSKTKNTTAVFIILFIILVEEIFLGRFANVFLFDKASWIDRERLFAAGQKMFFDRPLFGTGLGGFITYLPKYLKPPFLFQPAHSFFVMVVVETGILGLTLFLAFVGTVFKTAYRFKHRGLLLSLIIVFFLGLFDHYFYTAKQTQWLLVLILSLVGVEQGNRV